jgi:hypothetical protein
VEEFEDAGFLGVEALNRLTVGGPIDRVERTVGTDHLCNSLM